MKIKIKKTKKNKISSPEKDKSLSPEKDKSLSPEKDKSLSLEKDKNLSPEIINTIEIIDYIEKIPENEGLEDDLDLDISDIEDDVFQDSEGDELDIEVEELINKPNIEEDNTDLYTTFTNTNTYNMLVKEDYNYGYLTESVSK